MYLKRLETVGFKSFAERINVSFVPGVTAVVGPNGSGKSNVTDAIRWVLGEQSAKSLRGEKMEDIIFQGSDSRKAQNFAEVTLVLDNEDQTLPIDYGEVSITRRLYRSGDSEFYMNKQLCRLKDIVSLFTDSGLGREAYSIISQGKVEEILSSKADERRIIFEEAAGVLKYKQRKKKAEHKLEETQENLNRVEDIISEIETQLRPLEVQAQTAEKYLDLKEKLKKEEVSLLISEIEQLYVSWQSLLEEIEQTKTDVSAVQSKIDEEEKQLEVYNQSLSKIDEETDRLQSKLLTVTEQLEKAEGKKQLLHERSKHTDKNKEKLTRQLTETKGKIDQLKKDKQKENKIKADIKQQKDHTEKRLKELEALLSADQDSIHDNIENLKSEYIEFLNKQAAARNEKQSISQQLKQEKEKNNSQTERFKHLLSSRKTLTNQLTEAENAYNEQAEAVNTKQKSLANIKEDLEKERDYYQKAQNRLYQGYQYIEKLKSKKEMLEEMKNDFQGFFQGVKAVLKARADQELSGIHGAVIELIHVPKEMTTAIETVLGGSAQHIVARDDQTARDAIAWLKKANKGRATFLPLPSIEERFVRKDILAQIENHPGYIGIASNLVETEGVYQKVIAHLMGHVVVAGTLKDANEIAQKSRRKYRIVTMEGDVVHPGGSMSGGAQKKQSSSLFSREKELQELTDKIDDYETTIFQYEKKVQMNKKKISEMEKKQEAEEAVLRDGRTKLQALHSTYKETEMELKSVNENLSFFDQNQQQFHTEYENLVNRSDALTNELNQLKQKLEELNGEITHLQEQEKAFKENKEQLIKDYQQQQIIFAEQKEKWKSQQERTTNVQNQLEELQSQYAEINDELTSINEALEMEQTAEELNQSIHGKQVEKKQMTTTIRKQKDAREETARYIEQKESKQKEMKERQLKLNEKIQEKEIKANRLDVDLENRLNHLQSEYTITYEKAKKTYPKAEDLASAKARVSELMMQMEQLGTINTGAIDEYERLSERYQFLMVQKNDLIEGKTNLFTVIDEMDLEMTNRFETTFMQIKKEFTVVFKQLFGGGHAKLELTDPDNLLETGVDIVAEPPGKKLQHLGLLSGGERALTAIALLFAILRVRPVPFCILDEAEAALDEVNVARFAKYVKSFSEETQFIVITHRRGTMEEADVLYGVTMQESGVSRFISVQLEDTGELIHS